MHLLFKLYKCEMFSRAIVVSKKVTDEGEVIPFHQTELKVHYNKMDKARDRICLISNQLYLLGWYGCRR